MKRLFISSFLFISIANLLIIFIVMPAISEMMKVSIRVAIEQNDPNLSRGKYSLLLQELQGIPQAEWKEYIEKLRTHMGHPVFIKEFRYAGFTNNQRSQLLAGNAVVIDYGKSVWQRVGNSSYIVGMGPFPKANPGIRVIMVTWVMMTLIIVTVLLVWVFFFWRKLMTVSATTVNFGNGNFDVRVTISPRSVLAPLAGAFNRMADRIQTLIQSHKELTNAVSHELRTPIARIRFGLEMMRSSPDERARESYTEGIHKDVDELDELVSELLIYAKFDRETMELQCEEYDIASWLEDLVASLTTLPFKVQHVCLLDNKGMKACFDTRHMGRAVGNLLQNAARYGNGKARLTLEQEEDCILIHVDDNGPGIPEADRERIFEPFTRLDASRSRESGGSGLGLGIVKRVAICHGGTVAVSNSELGGSRFSIKWKAIQ
jgi:signal transduction histidine kinase